MPQRLSEFTNSKIDVRLATADSVQADFRVDFMVADLHEIQQVDAQLHRLIEGRRLDVRAIEEFVRACLPFDSAVRYFDAFAQYFFGVLARERSTESALDVHQYRERYDLAASVLSHFETLPARTVSALIAFHYNQFDRTVVSGLDSPRLHHAAARLQSFLRPTGLDGGPSGARRGGGLDALFADAETERVIRWIAQPFDESAGAVFAVAEAYVQDCEPLDQTKLRIVLGEYYLQAGDSRGARRHVDALLHNDLTEDWARRMRRQLGRGEQ